MIQKLYLLVLPGLALILGACGSSPAVRYFGLETIETEHQINAVATEVMAIGPIRVPDYLKRSQMVRRGQGAEMIVDDFNRWAEPLDDAIHRTIASNVDGLVNNLVVVAFPTGVALDIDYRVFGRIDRFEQDNGGTAVLDIQWGIGDSSGEVIAAARRTRYESRVSNQGDPASTAEAMSEALELLSKDIATEIEVLLR